MLFSKVINIDGLVFHFAGFIFVFSSNSILFMKWLGLFGFIVFFSCSSSRMTETNLYFGQTRPGGAMITEKEWNHFKEEYLSKVFKEGCSVTSISGRWYDTAAHQMITEPSYMVTCDYKSSARISRQIDSLCYWYKKMFDQQAVLRVDKKVKATFL